MKMKRPFLFIVLIPIITCSFHTSTIKQSEDKQKFIQQVVAYFGVDTGRFVFWNLRKAELRDFTIKYIDCEEVEQRRLGKIKPMIELEICAITLSEIRGESVLIVAALDKQNSNSYCAPDSCEYVWPSKYSFVWPSKYSFTRKYHVWKHEQLHFDIAEIATRYTRKAFISYLNVISDSSDAETIFSRIAWTWRDERMYYNKIIDEFSLTHTTLETYEKFKPWINKKLKELEAYANPIIYFKSSSNSKRKLSNNK